MYTIGVQFIGTEGVLCLEKRIFLRETYKY